MLGVVPAYVLMILLSPIFLVLALLYMVIHSERACETEEESPLPAIGNIGPGLAQ